MPPSTTYPIVVCVVLAGLLGTAGVGCGKALIQPGHRGLVFDPSHGGGRHESPVSGLSQLLAISMAHRTRRPVRRQPCPLRRGPERCK